MNEPTRRTGTTGTSSQRTLFGLRNLLAFVRHPLTFLESLVERFGDVAALRMLGRDWVMLSHPDDVEALFVKHQPDLQRDEYAHVLKRALGEGLLTSDGDLWRRQRKLAAVAFTPRKIRTYADTMAAVTERGLQRWRDGATVDLHVEMSHLTMEVVADVLFGASVAPADVGTVRESMEVINAFFAQSAEVVLRLPKWVPTPRNVQMNRAVAQIDRLLYGIIEARRRGEERDDLLGALLSARGDDGAGMTDLQLRDETVTLFLAGHETTALALTHALYLLSKHPEIEQRLHRELADVLNGRMPTQADVERLVYTERVIKEAMRLYPPAWVTGREVARPIEIAGRTLPAGTQVLVSQWVVHRDARWYRNPEAFDPDRWLPETAKARPKFAYFPFGGGARVCIGNHFAMMEAVLMLACIASRWRVELLPFERLEFAPSVTLRPKRGLRGRVVAREAQAATERRAPDAVASS